MTEPSRTQPGPDDVVLNPVTRQPCTYRDLPDAETEALLPRVLPPNWRRAKSRDFVGLFRSPSLMVLFSAGIEEDGKRWAHVSVSRADHTIPSWLDLTEVKETFFGRDATAVQILAPRAEHYSHPGIEVLHLWSCLDGAPALPNFLRARGGSL